MKLSKITIGWGIYIVISASFILQINLWLIAKVTDQFLAGSFWVFSVLVMLAALAYALRQRLGVLRLLAALGVFALAYLLATRQAYFAEKTHILSYGLLGYLAARDLVGVNGAERLKGIALVAGFVVVVSLADEVFQWAPPYRFCELNDVMTNIIGGVLGMGLFLALRKRQ